jgi:hypothetical protein
MTRLKNYYKTKRLLTSYIEPFARHPNTKMGKKAKSTKGALRAKERKLDKSTLPPPPKAVSDEVRTASPNFSSSWFVLDFEQYSVTEI